MSAFQKTFLSWVAGGLLAAFVLCALFGFFFSQGSSEARPVANDRMLSAVARFGQQRSGRPRNTLYFPTNANRGDEMVVYWREENVFFSFPTNVSEAAVASPSLVVSRVWTPDESSFRHPGDPEFRTSTYLESWPKALKWMRAAVVEGRMLVLEPVGISVHNSKHP